MSIEISGRDRTTVVLVGHQMSLINSADHIFVLKDGAVECESTRFEIAEHSKCYKNATYEHHD